MFGPQQPGSTAEFLASFDVFWGVLYIKPRSDSSFIFPGLIPVSFSVQAVRTQALCFSSLCDLNPQMVMLRSETGLIWLQIESETNYSTDVSKKLLSVIPHLWPAAGFAFLDVSIGHNFSCHATADSWLKRRLWEGIVQTCWLLMCTRAQSNWQVTKCQRFQKT